MANVINTYIRLTILNLKCVNSSDLVLEIKNPMNLCSRVVNSQRLYCSQNLCDVFELNLSGLQIHNIYKIQNNRIKKFVYQ